MKFDPIEDPVFFTHHPNWDVPGLEILPVGLVFRAWKPGVPAPKLAIPLIELPGENDPRVPKDYLTQNLIGHLHYMLGFTFEKSDWPRAYAEFRRATAASPTNDVQFYNLGLIFSRNGLYDEALAAFERSFAINPRHIASRSRPRAEERIAEMRLQVDRLRSFEQEIRASGALDGLAAGTSAYHRALADELEGGGEPVAAAGHRLRAELRAAGLPGS